MGTRIRQTLLMALTCVVFIACQNAPENKKAESGSSTKSVSEQNAGKAIEAASENHPGKSVYRQNCLACHQADGSGVPNMHPPLSSGSWVGKEPEKLITILLKGLSGKVEVKGEVYKNFMPSQAKLTDQEIADVLSYIRISFGNNFEAVTPEMVSKVRSGK